MWKGAMTLLRGRTSTRKLITCTTAFLVACFAYGLTQTAPVNAVQPTPPNQTTSQTRNNDTIQWENGTLTYKGLSYEGPQTATQDNGLSLPENATYYTAHDTANAGQNNVKGYIIYFEPGTDMASVDAAKFITADYDIGSGEYSNLASATTISVDTSTYSPSQEEPETSCAVESIGWMVCPISNWIAEGMDAIYTLIEGYLVFQPISYGNNAVYKMWEVVRNIANILFVIGFLILIYAQITGAVMSNYTIKKMLPRTIIAAVLVNVSFWICAIAVDLSNILGASVQNLFVNMQSSVGGAAVDTISWQSVTIAVLGGTGLAIAGGLTVMGVGVGAAALMIFAALIPAIFAIFVAIVILAARQALIMLLIVIAPLAFVAYLLPNTEDWFNRWRKFFTTLLVFFPAFAVLFGASQLAGMLIIQTAPNIPVVILGLVVQVVPLFITPFLIKLSSGVLGTVAGLANDKSKGLFDRTQNWARGNADYLKAKSMANKLNPDYKRKSLAERKDGAKQIMRHPLNSAKGRYKSSDFSKHGAAFTAASFVNRGEKRKALTEAYGQQAQARYQQYAKAGKRVFDEKGLGAAYQQANEAAGQERFNQLSLGDKSLMSADAKSRLKDSRYRNLPGTIHKYHDAHHAADDLKKKIDAHGAEHYSEKLVNAAAGSYEEKLRKINQETVVHQKRAETAKSIIQKAGEAEYHDLTMGNEHVQNIRLRSERADKDALAAEGKVKQMFADVELKGGKAEGIISGNIEVAEGIFSLRKDSAIARKRLEATENIIKQQDEAFWNNALLDKSVGDNQEKRKQYEKILATRLEESLGEKQAKRAAKDAEDLLTKVGFVGDKALQKNERGISTTAFMKQGDNLKDPMGNIGDSIEREDTTLGKIANQISAEGLSEQLAAESIKNTEAEQSDTYTNIIRGTAQKDPEDLITSEISKGLRKRARGINYKGADSDYGEARLVGRSRKEKSSRLMENVDNAESTLSETILPDLMDIRDKGTFSDGRKATPEEQYAADIQILTKKGNLAAVVESLNTNALNHGMAFDHLRGKFYIPERDEFGVVEKEDVIDANGNKVIDPETGEPKQRIKMMPGTDYLSDSEAEDHSDAQQMNLYGYEKGHQKSALMSGTMRGLAQTGQRYHSTADAIKEEWGGGKMKADDFANAKIDDWLEWIRILRKQGFRDKHLSDSVREKTIARIRTAQHSPNLEDRVHRAMSAVMNYLELPKGTDTSSKAKQTELETNFMYITKKDHHSDRSFQVWMPQQAHPNASKQSVYNEDADKRNDAFPVKDGKRTSSDVDFRK